jgi:hypothetical protein
VRAQVGAAEAETRRRNFRKLARAPIEKSAIFQTASSSFLRFHAARRLLF